MKLNLEDKVVLITGSSEGIGFGIAKLLHSYGCNVIINGRSQIKLEKALSVLSGSIGIVGDLRLPSDTKKVVETVFQKFGRIDGLVCNVGSGRSSTPGEEHYEEWQRVFEINLWSATNAVEASRELLVESKGAIVCISSICGLEVVSGAPVTYSAAKAALNSYVRCVARPLGKLGVRINAIAAGNINTETSIWKKRLISDRPSVEQLLDKEVSLGKLGASEDVAKMTAFLLSSAANFMTGSIVNVDGGQARSS